MEAEAPQSLTDSAPADRKNPRRCPLQTCCVSLTTFARIAFSKSQELDGRIGSMMKIMGSLVRLFIPLVHIMQYLCLAEISLIDKFIIAFESLVEAVFPPSTHLFNKIDEFLEIVEVLPSISKDALDNFPMMIHQSPLLEYVVCHPISRLKIFFSLSTSKNAREKEIPIDTSYTELHTECASIEVPHESTESLSHPKNETFEKFYEASSDEVGVEKGTQEKDAEMRNEERESVEKGMEEEQAVEGGMDGKGESAKVVKKVESDEEEVMVAEKEGMIESKEVEVAMKKKGEGEDVEKWGISDPILELFDSSWHMIAPKKR